MRHSRRAVMAERYKLYAKKNILNSRYLVRNLQIGLLVLVFVAMFVGTVVLLCTGAEEEVVVAETKVSVKDALFSNDMEQKVVAKATEEVTEESDEEATTEVLEATESVFAQKVQTELDSAITEVVSNVNPMQEEETEVVESAFDGKCIAKVEETLNIRSNPSAEAEFVGQMNNGAIAIVVGTEGDWTKIKSGDVEGYVLTEYVLTGKEAEEFAKDYVTVRATVLEDGVNIRAEQSTESEILVVVDKDDTVTVLKEAEEDETVVTDSESVATEVVTQETTVVAVKEDETTEVAEESAMDWIAVELESGEVGYVSAELVKIDELYEIAVSAEELQRRAEEEVARLAAEEAARQAAAAQNNTSSNTSNNNDTSNDYQGATTTPVTATESGECIGTFTITAYCGCKKCSGGNGKTASGTTPTEGRTIAADTSVLPFGTQVVIDGVVYTVEDTGSGVRGNHIDIFFATHAKALAFGRRTIKVYKY